MDQSSSGAHAQRLAGTFEVAEQWLAGWLACLERGTAPPQALPGGTFARARSLFMSVQAEVTGGAALPGNASLALIQRCVPAIANDPVHLVERLAIWITFLRTLQEGPAYPGLIDPRILTELRDLCAAICRIGNDERTARLHREAHPWLHRNGG